MVASKPIVRGPVDGNAFAEFLRRAMEGDYNHLLRVAGDYVEFEL